MLLFVITIPFEKGAAIGGLLNSRCAALQTGKGVGLIGARNGLVS
jgi:hypothetical protein